jgi:hypothetical protein
METQNHLIVGLGGTGGKIIRAMRKMIYRNLRQLTPENVELRFLYVDSDDSLMGLGDESWKALGKSVQLPNSSTLLIEGTDLKSVIENVNSYPGIKPWIGDRQQWRGILESARGAKIAGGQKRRLGRFLFANKVADFRDQAGRLVDEMTSSGQAGVTFHVCCGLAGGTGSGTVIDVASQLRSKFGSDENRRILLYTLLPEEQPNPDWAGPNYHANGYAALRELNALAVNDWVPHDISGEKTTESRYDVEAERLDLKDPFNGCYVFSNRNAAGYRARVKDEVPDIAASFLYHKIVTAADIGDSGLNQLSRQETFEMQGGSGGVEGEREREDGPQTRSARFLTFGIKQLAYPEDEILEYLTFSFAEQAALQLRYNNWSEAVGYTDEPRNQSFDAEVRSAEVKNRWRITDEHLTLSEGILDDERENTNWKPIGADWSNAANNYIELVRQNSDREEWPYKLEQRFEKRFDDEFRGQGVEAFYHQRSDSRMRERYVREIRGLLEKELFEKWVQGDQSMQEISQLLTDLRHELEKRKSNFDERITDQQELAKKHRERVDANSEEWSNIGVLSSWVLDKHEKLLKDIKQDLKRHYLARTRVVAFRFAKELLRTLIDEVDELRGVVDRAASMLAQATERFQDEVAARLNDEGEDDLEKQVIRFYDPSEVQDLSTRLVKDEEVQTQQTAQMRRRIANLAGQTPTFAKLNSNTNLGDLVDLFQEQEEESVRDAHNTADLKDRSSLLGVNIINRLYEKYGNSQERLRDYVHDVLKKAETFARFSDEEKNKKVPGGATDFSTFTVILPDTKDHPEFREALKEAFEKAVPSGAQVEFALSPKRENEIIILNVASSFPLRFLESTRFLKDEYERRKADSENAALEIHLEGTGELYPSLYQPDRGDIVERTRPYLLLAHTMDLFEVEKDRAGRSTLVYEILDEDGLPVEEIQLGQTLVEAEEKLDVKLSATIREAVEERLEDSSFDPPEARQEVFEQAVEKTKDIRDCARDGKYKAYADAAREAKQILDLA